MKIIDLLNKIANGEEVPKKIKYIDDKYIWTGANYYNKENDEFLDQHIALEDLEYPIEIIEEEKKIPEKLILCTLSNNDSADFTTLQDFNNRDIQRTINWILDYLKSKGE